MALIHRNVRLAQGRLVVVARRHRTPREGRFAAGLAAADTTVAAGRR